MINTFIDNKLNIYNELFLQSFLSCGFSICIWTYNVESIRTQIPFGVKIKDANELVPRFIYDKINNTFSDYFLNYFKFVLLYDLGGCFSNPTIIPIKNNLIDVINRSESLIFGDDFYCKFLSDNKLCQELDDNFIKITKLKNEFPRNFFFIIEHELFGKDLYDNKYLDYSYKLKFGDSFILSGKPFNRDLYYHAIENKVSIFSNRTISYSYYNNILLSTLNIERNLKLIDTLCYIDIKHIDFNKIENKTCPINIIKERIENSGF